MLQKGEGEVGGGRQEEQTFIRELRAHKFTTSLPADVVEAGNDSCLLDGEGAMTAADR